MTSVHHGGAGVQALADTLVLVEGSKRPSAGHLAPDVRAWLASPEDGLQAASESVRGAAATAGALSSLAPSRLTLIGAVGSDRWCWAEIARQAGGEDETCLAGVSLDTTGEVSRLIWLRVPLVQAYDLDAGGDAPAVQPILEQYFADLMSSRFLEAAAHFTVDTVYSHPPYAGGTERVLFHGREALWRGFAAERGPSPARQIITGIWQQGNRGFVQGVVEGVPDGGTFFATAQMTPEGEIARYIAFYTTMRIPRL